MNSTERLIKYAKINTRSDATTHTTPSTAVQLDLARELVKECEALGLSNVRLSEYGYVYADIPANTDEKVDVLGLIAHMDTTPEISGENVKPRIVENYNGEDIVLNDEYTLMVKDFPNMLAHKGHNLVVTDGTTCLGGDDKAGIAIIMTVAEYLMAHPEVKHGKIVVGFTPDEEIGEGADHFDVEGFGADFAFTLDGGEPEALCYETFNAAQATVSIHGVSIHPGSAKDKMINAINVAMDFHGCLPAQARPEHTDGFDGFNHLNEIEGDVESCRMHYIIRNHNEVLFNNQKQLFRDVETFINKKYGKHVVDVEIKEQYRNMKSGFEGKEYILELANNAILSAGLTPVSSSARGGTDGASLTFKGLPCPNLGTGGGNCHGRYEFVDINDMEKMEEVVLHLIKGLVK